MEQSFQADSTIWGDNKPDDRIKYITNNQVTLKVVDGSLKEVLIGKQTLKIGDVLGKSNAIVWHINSSPINTPMCLKISAGGKTDLNKDKIQYINNHPNDFTKIYYFDPNIDFKSEFELEGKKFTTIDICILDEVQKTVGDFCKMLMDYNSMNSISRTFSYNFIGTVLYRLVDIITTLNKSGYYYTDLKPANIGVIDVGDHFEFKLIDVDSIFKDESGMLHTSYTTGYINNNISLMRIQYLNIVFTIISLLFIDNGHEMCTKDFGQYRKDDKMYNLMKWFNKSSSYCGEYKYILLIGTYMIIQRYFNTTSISVEMIISYYNKIIRNVNKIITGNRPNDYFEFIAKVLVIMTAVILIQDVSLLPNIIPLFMNNGPTIPLVPVTKKNILDTINLQPHVSNGLMIVDYIHYYITQHCNDPECSVMDTYGKYFMDIQ